MEHPRRWAISLAIPLVAVAVISAAGQGLAPAVARTSDGRIDLQGMWLNDTATPLERPVELAGSEFFTEEQAREYEKRYQLDRTIAISRDKDFELDAAGDLDTYEPGRVLPGGRTSLITDPADGKVPALTPQAQQLVTERAQRREQHYAENPEDLQNAERCLVVGNAAVPPIMPAFYNNTVQIVQTRDYVVILSEMIHEARVIPLDGRPHLPPGMHRWTGDSIGRWEGDTLVVDTANFTTRTTLRGSGPALHLIERFTLSGPDTLSYRFTIDDPASFVRPWSAESVMTRTDGMMFEYACHEANYSMSNVLRGARFAERKKSER
jgi:hypothetical protein